jgi:hypothetical protein
VFSFIVAQKTGYPVALMCKGPRSQPHALVTEQMTAIEKDHSGGAIGAVVSIVQVVPKEGEPEMRFRSNIPRVMLAQLIKELSAQMEAEGEQN